MSKKSKTKPKDQISFQRFIAEVAAKETTQPILNEYNDIQSHVPTFKNFLEKENSSRNRHFNFLLYDHTRVKLRSETKGKHKQSDYIHASFVDGYRHPNAYILTQGPKSETVDDFWRMILQQDVKLIVLLGETRDKKGDILVNDFWPLAKQQLTFCEEQISVRTKKMCVGTTFDSYDITAKREREKKKEDHKILLLQYLDWKDDEEIPSTFSDFVALVRMHQRRLQGTIPDTSKSTTTSEKKTRSRNFKFASEGPPTVIVCSSGVSRAGTFVAYDISTRRMLDEQLVNLEGVVRHIRWQRYGCVQLQSHYLWLVEALVNFSMQIGLLPKNRKELDIASFNRELKDNK